MSEHLTHKSTTPYPPPTHPKKNTPKFGPIFYLDPCRYKPSFSARWQQPWPRCFSLTAQGEYGDVHGVYGDGGGNGPQCGDI